MFGRFGLRARVITAFAVGALLLSLLLSAVTYSLTLANLVERREGDAYRSAISNAQGINGDLTSRTDEAQLRGIMASYNTPAGSQQGMLHRASYHWVDTDEFSERALPDSFLAEISAGNAAEMHVDVDADPIYVVGLPLPNAQANAAYIQTASLSDVADALDGLLVTLAGASAVTTILGLGFGVYVATRLFSPLTEVSSAAELIAEGDLSTRLDPVTDPDLDRLVSSFNHMTSALEERIERDARFASDVSHELRSPLMTLTGSVAVLERRRDDLPERAQVALDLLSADIGRFKLLVEDLLEISRFDVGAVELDVEEVLFGEFVRQALLAATSGREIPIVHAGDSEEAFIEIDKRRVAQVIRNLSENADKYADGVTQARLWSDGADVRIELEDEGPGVPRDERELIFERFARGSEGGRRGTSTGVGLGLSLVTEHLRLHGGTISVTDRVDGLLGARFVIELPGVVVPE